MKKIVLPFLLLYASCLWATDYYVSINGNDSNNGTSIGTAWKTMDQVRSFAWLPGFVAGDKILFEGGETFTTTQGIYIQLDITYGTAVNPILFSSYGTGKAILKAKASDAFMAWAPATGTVGLGLEFKNLILEGDSVSKTGPKSAEGISVYNSSSSGLDYLLIEDCEIRGFAGNGIAVGRDLGKGRFTNVIVRRVESHHNPGAIGVSPHSGTGIVVAGADGALIEHCIAYKNGINNDNPGGPIGIWFWDCINSTIQYCESYSNETTKGDGGGFDIDGGCQNCIIQYCYSHNNAGAGYLFAQFDGANNYGPLENNTIRYNISENDGRKGSYAGIMFWGANASNKVGVNEIYNNTVYVGGTADNGTPGAVKFLGTQMAGVKLRNNIFITDKGFPLINGSAMDTTMAHFQNNNYWTVNGSAFKINWGSTYNTLSAWQAATDGQEKLGGTVPVGYSIDPKLEDAGNGGTIGNTLQLNNLTAYKLLAGSGLIDKGFNLTIAPYNLTVGSTDYYGNSIPQGEGFDIGAHDNFIIPSYTLVVNNGTGDGDYEESTVVAIQADAPETGKVFDAWTGDVTNVDNVNLANTSVTMPAQATTLTATYRFLTYTISFNVSDGTNPIANAAVSFNATTIITNASGIAEFTDVAYGTALNYSVVKTGYNTASGSVNATANNAESVTMTPISAGTHSVTFTITDGSDIIEGVKVNFNTQDVLTNSSGEAVFAGVADATGMPYVITFSGYDTIRGALDVAGADVNKTISLVKTLYAVTINNGTGSGNYYAGATVNIQANPVIATKVFDKWIGDIEVLSSVNQESISFIMPDSAIELTATYKDIPVYTYAVTIINGSGSGNYQEGATVSIVANAAPADQVFDFWTGDVKVLAVPSESSTSFVMPDSAITLTANYRPKETGINTSDMYVDIYPNPASNVLIVSASAIVNEIQILSLDGKMVMQRKLNSSNCSIDISELSAGVYFINLILKDNTCQKVKMVKQ